METDGRALWIVAVGAVLIAAVIWNFSLNLISGFRMWSGSGWVFQLLLIAAGGIALIWYGSLLYHRVPGA